MTNHYLERSRNSHNLVMRHTISDFSASTGLMTACSSHDFSQCSGNIIAYPKICCVVSCDPQVTYIYLV